jgi:hypothetical protein
MHKFTNTLTPAQVYRYAIDCAPRRCEGMTSGVIPERHAA